MSSINWSSTLEDARVISKIAKRAIKMFSSLSILDVNMDIAACHLNGCELRLRDLLEADDFNFMHDVLGIRSHLDRKTGKLMDYFLPRFSAR